RDQVREDDREEVERGRDRQALPDQVRDVLLVVVARPEVEPAGEASEPVAELSLRHAARELAPGREVDELLLGAEPPALDVAELPRAVRRKFFFDEVFLGDVLELALLALRLELLLGVARLGRQVPLLVSDERERDCRLALALARAREDDRHELRRRG